MDNIENRRPRSPSSTALLFALFVVFFAAVVGAVAGFGVAKTTETLAPVTIRTSGAQAGFADLVAKVRPAVANFSPIQTVRTNQTQALAEHASAFLANLTPQCFGV